MSYYGNSMAIKCFGNYTLLQNCVDISAGLLMTQDMYEQVRII